MDAEGARPWPPDEVLALVGLTRAEWNDMERTILRDGLSYDLAVRRALIIGVIRRRNELAKGKR